MCKTHALCIGILIALFMVQYVVECSEKHNGETTENNLIKRQASVRELALQGIAKTEIPLVELSSKYGVAHDFPSSKNSAPRVFSVGMLSRVVVCQAPVQPSDELRIKCPRKRYKVKRHHLAPTFQSARGLVTARVLLTLHTSEQAPKAEPHKVTCFCETTEEGRKSQKATISFPSKAQNVSVEAPRVRKVVIHRRQPVRLSWKVHNYTRSVTCFHDGVPLHRIVSQEEGLVEVLINDTTDASAGIYTCESSQPQKQEKEWNQIIELHVLDGWSEWHVWIPCSTRCGIGQVLMRRTCLNSDRSSCHGKTIKVDRCIATCHEILPPEFIQHPQTTHTMTGIAATLECAAQHMYDFQLMFRCHPIRGVWIQDTARVLKTFYSSTLGNNTYKQTKLTLLGPKLPDLEMAVACHCEAVAWGTTARSKTANVIFASKKGQTASSNSKGVSATRPESPTPSARNFESIENSSSIANRTVDNGGQISAGFFKSAISSAVLSITICAMMALMIVWFAVWYHRKRRVLRSIPPVLTKCNEHEPGTLETTVDNSEDEDETSNYYNSGLVTRRITFAETPLHKSTTRSTSAAIAIDSSVEDRAFSAEENIYPGLPWNDKVKNFETAHSDSGRGTSTSSCVDACSQRLSGTTDVISNDAFETDKDNFCMVGQTEISPLSLSTSIASIHSAIHHGQSPMESDQNFSYLPSEDKEAAETDSLSSLNYSIWRKHRTQDSIKSNKSTISAMSSVSKSTCPRPDFPDTADTNLCAWGRIDHQGGCLSIANTGIQLYIPEFALAEGQEEDIYIAVMNNKGQYPALEKGQAVIGPAVVCGPDGLQFNKPVYLTVPHNTVMEDDGIPNLTGKSCPTYSSGSSWRTIKSPTASASALIADDESVGNADGPFSFMDENSLQMMITHFTNFVPVAEPKQVKIKVVPFSTPPTAVSDCSVRIYCVPATKAALEVVRSMEEGLHSIQADSPKLLFVNFTSGDVHVHATPAMDGWECVTDTHQIIPFQHVWEGVEDSPNVSFGFTRSQNDVFNFRYHFQACQVGEQEIKVFVTHSVKRVHGSMSSGYESLESGHTPRKPEIPQKALRKLCILLDPSDDPCTPSWKDLAGTLGMKNTSIRFISSRKESPTEEVIGWWDGFRREKVPLPRLAEMLEQIGRRDAAMVLESLYSTEV